MDDPAQPRRRRLGLFLGLSLALNLAVVGAVIGALLFARTLGPERSGAELREAGRLPVAVMLPSEARAALREGLRDHGGRDRAADRAVFRDQAAQLDSALRADPFDPVRVGELFAERRAFRDSRAAEVDQVLVEVLTGMNPNDRAAFADRMQRRHHKARSHKKADRP